MKMYQTKKMDPVGESVFLFAECAVLKPKAECKGIFPNPQENPMDISAAVPQSSMRVTFFARFAEQKICYSAAVVLLFLCAGNRVCPVCLRPWQPPSAREILKAFREILVTDSFPVPWVSFVRLTMKENHG